jgi:hypothetical protein
MNAGTSNDSSCSCGPEVVVAFTKVLLRAGDLTILASEPAFRDNGTCEDTRVDDCWAAYMSFGEARDCTGDASHVGVFEIDLRGTPFHIHPDATFEPNGFNAGGDVTIQPDRKRATVTGGGFCGGFGPKENELPLAQD